MALTPVIHVHGIHVQVLNGIQKHLSYRVSFYTNKTHWFNKSVFWQINISYCDESYIKWLTMFFLKREDFSQSSLIEERNPEMRDEWETSSSFKKHL